MKTLLETQLEELEIAKRLVEKGWTQKVLARDSQGNETGELGSKATCFCVIGACMRAKKDISPNPYTGIAFNDNQNLLRTILTLQNFGEIRFVDEWNDEEDRTQEQVVTLFDKAISLVKKSIEDRKDAIDAHFKQIKYEAIPEWPKATPLTPNNLPVWVDNVIEVKQNAD